MKKKILFIVVGILVLFLLFWAASVLKCEYSTSKDGAEFAQAGEELEEIVKPHKEWEAITCSEAYAEAYFYSADSGEFVSFGLKNGK